MFHVSERNPLCCIHDFQPLFHNQILYSRLDKLKKYFTVNMLMLNIDDMSYLLILKLINCVISKTNQKSGFQFQYPNSQYTRDTHTCNNQEGFVPIVFEMFADLYRISSNSRVDLA